MIAGIVIGSVLLFLFLLLLCPIKMTLRYRETLSLTIQYAFLKFTVLPAKEKPEWKQQKKEKKPEQKEKEEEKKPSFFERMKEQHGLSGLLHLAVELAKLAGSTMKKFFSHVVVYHLHGDIQIGTGDAAQTAILYGKTCAVLEPSMAVILAAVPEKKRRDVRWNVAPDFAAEQTEIGVYAQVGMKPLFILSVAIGALIRLIRIYLSQNKEAKSQADYSKAQQNH